MFVTSLQLHKIFADCAEDARFRDWNNGRDPEVRFVCVCEHQTFWSFTPRAWWVFVSKAIRNKGSYYLPLSRALRNRPRGVIKGEDGEFHASDDTVHCVNVLNWTVEDWKRELN